MKRMFAASAVLLALTAFASAAEKQQPKIIWHGQSFFEVISGAGTASSSIRTPLRHTAASKWTAI